MAAMIVGICKFTLFLPGNQGLKSKRRVISSLSSRIGNKFNVSIAEVSDNEKWQLATLGFSCVSNNSRHVQEVIASVVDFVQNTRNDVEIVTHEIETISGF
jgi:hypothetical protein